MMANSSINLQLGANWTSTAVVKLVFLESVIMLVDNKWGESVSGFGGPPSGNTPPFPPRTQTDSTDRRKSNTIYPDTLKTIHTLSLFWLQQQFRWFRDLQCTYNEILWKFLTNHVTDRGSPGQPLITTDGINNVKLWSYNNLFTSFDFHYDNVTDLCLTKQG